MPKQSPTRPWLTIRNFARAGTASAQVANAPVEFIINGPIGKSWWDDSGTSSKEFREAFAKVPAGTKIHVRINSEGGSVADALEIYNVIRARTADVTCYVDGYALSSASIIALSGGRTITPHSSIVMIHEPWSMTVGDETDHRKAADMLSKHGDTIAQIYARKTGKPAADMRELMRVESWFTGQEAITNGLADAMSDTAECPECGHLQCTECSFDGDNVRCCACNNSSEASDWDSDMGEAEASTAFNFKGLDLSSFNNVPEHVRDLVAGKRFTAPAMAGAVTNHQSPIHKTMDKAKILAALKKAGVELAENASDEDILSAFTSIAGPITASGDGSNSGADNATRNTSADTTEVALLRAQLDDEKRIRITAEVKRRGEHRIENKNLQWWINLAMKNEAEVFAQIDSLPIARPGGEPLGISQVSIVESRLEEIRKMPVAAKRYESLKAEWNGLIADAITRDQRQRLAPMAGNTYSASLVTQFLIDGAVTKLQHRWAALRAFSRDYSTDRYKPRATGQLKFATSGNTVEKNATNFETGDSVVTNVQIAVDQYTSKFHVSNDELNSGLRMENLVEVNIAALADKILYVAFAPLATGNFTTNAAIVRSAAAFNFSDMADAWGKLKKSPIKNAVLDGEYMARIINQPALFQAAGIEGGEGWKKFGWDGVHLNTNWSGHHDGAADQNIRGLFCNPQALGAVAGLPLTPPNIPGNVLQEGTMVVPDVDISVATFNWFSTATRTMWISFDLMFGSSLLDESAGVLLLSS